MQPIDVHTYLDNKKQEQEKIENELIGRFLRWAEEQFYIPISSVGKFLAQKAELINSLTSEAKNCGVDDQLVKQVCSSLTFTFPQTSTVSYEVTI